MGFEQLGRLVESSDVETAAAGELLGDLACVSGPPSVPRALAPDRAQTTSFRPALGVHAEAGADATRSPDAEGSRRVAPPVLLPAMLAFVAGAVLLAVAGAFADGEAVTHTRQHGVGAMVGTAIAVAGAVVWQPRWTARLARYGAIAAFTSLALAQAVESVGATGNDPTNSLAETETHPDIHELGNACTTLSIVLAMIASALVVLTFCSSS